ncbi:MAG: hypothetical protein J7J61_05370 [Candidatus Hydrothermae bacterium]|nr:hypothetical protein [Candidatus Hydrothermae bacterium]
MIMEISEEEKEYFLREYKRNFERYLTSKGELKYYFQGIAIGIKTVLLKLEIVTDSDILELQKETYDKLEAEVKEPLVYE